MALEIKIQISPPMKYPKVISDLSSSTYTAYSAAAKPPLPLRNLPGPKTEHVAALRMAQSSSPIAVAVKARYRICTALLVWSGKLILSELNPKPASIAPMPEMPLYRPTK